MSRRIKGTDRRHTDLPFSLLQNHLDLKKKERRGDKLSRRHKTKF